MNDYIRKLEQIADVHLLKHPAHLVDNKVLAYDREKMLPYVKGPKVLELGCGDGDWTLRMIELFGEAHVVDASTKLLNHVAQANGNKVTIYNSLFEDFTPPHDLRFNTIVATHVLEHVDDPIHVLRRCRQWLAADGTVLIIVPNATSIHRQLAVKMGIQETVYDFSPRDREVGHQRVYDLPALRNDVAQAGYQILVERGLFLKVLPNAMMTEFSNSLLEALADISEDLPTQWMANIGLVVKPAV